MTLGITLLSNPQAFEACDTDENVLFGETMLPRKTLSLRAIKGKTTALEKLHAPWKDRLANPMRRG